MGDGKLLKEKLFRKIVNGGSTLSNEELKEVSDYCEGYKKFLAECKTEREFVSWCIPLLEKMGFKPIEKNVKYKTGDKVYYNNRNKALLCAVIGRQPIEKGVHITAAHIDSPRIDLKQNPLYEDNGFGYFKTHYYGGIKKYQWTTTPMALHGVVIKKDGTKVEFKLGEEETDPVFCFTDLLPHLSEDMNKRTMKDGIRGEELNALIGSLPYRDEEISEKVKLNIANILYEKYGIVEDDFESSELTFVPALKPVDVGFDRSMMGAYGHDDKVCAYGELMGLLHADPEFTAVAVFADKEETGSDTPSGMDSCMLANFVSNLATPYGIQTHEVLSASKCVSADVTVAYDPTFGDTCEKNNTAFLNRGVAVSKFTGSRGKYSTNEATVEYTAEIEKILTDNGVLWQTGELGKVDQGGGGTVAKHISKWDIDTIDIGVPVISMHAPMEIVSKIDTYMMFRTSLAFYNK